jgi:hypothetical protein
LEQVTFNAVRGLLSDRLIEGACAAVGHVFRKRTLTPVITVLHMVLAAIWPEESLAASAALIWDHFLAACPFLSRKPPSSGSWSNARKRLPVALWEHLHRAVADTAAATSQRWDRWRGLRAVLADGTCVSMPDEPTLHERFGTRTGNHGPGRYPLARLVTLSLAQTMTILDYAVDAYATGENALLRRMLHRLGPNDLLVADRHFAGANLYGRYLAAGFQFLTRAHQRLNIARLRRLAVFGNNDFLTRLRIHSDHRKNDPTLPAYVTVRVIAAAVSTRAGRRPKPLWLVTSLLDPAAYPADEIVELYGRRWRIETLLRELKVRLGADVLRSRTVDGVQKELAARTIALNVLRTILLQAAAEHDLDPMNLSFCGAVRAVLSTSPILATAPPWRLAAIYHAMLFAIAHDRIRPRPGRQEPRAVRRETKSYPSLRITRAEWKRRWRAA